MKFPTPAETLAAAQRDAAEVIARIWAHGHGEFNIQIRPGSIRVCAGTANIFETVNNNAIDKRSQRG